MRPSICPQHVALGILFLLVLPFSSAAAGVRAMDVLQVPDEAVVSRGEFIRAVVKILELPLPEKEVQLPFARPIPPGLRPYVGAAYGEGGLTIFGKELLPARGITRGEALWFLVKLSDTSLEGVPEVKFQDVHKGSVAEEVVRIAVSQKWMQPLRKNIFGVRRELRGKEAKLLLSRFEGRGEREAVQEPSIIRIQLLPSQGPQPFPKSEILDLIWEIVQENFLYSDRLKPEDAAYDAAEAIVKKLNDPYTTFLRPAGTREFQVQIKGEVSGIGAQVEYKSDILTIISPIRGSPAESAGLKPGDQILSVDGENIQGIGFIESVEKVRGPKGSKAKLHIRRDGVEFDVTVTRDTIRVPEVEVSFQEEVAIVRLVQFGQTTENELRTVLKEVQEQNPKGLILDLRNNPGGLLHAATIVLSNFLPEGSAVARIKSRQEEYEEKTEDPPTIDREVPMMVLVNGGSASASEIVAGALQDANRATVLGEKTFGKGTVQQVLEFTDGSSLKLTIAEWFTPKGRKIDETGVEPDIKVPQGTEDRDVQMLRALELLRR